MSNFSEPRVRVGEGATIANLFVKLESKSPSTATAVLNLKASDGIERDIHANPLSPRQILVVRQEDLADLAIEPGALGENIVIAGTAIDCFKPGSLLQFDTGAAIRLTFYCEPCKKISHLVKSLQSIHQRRGILGVAIANGRLAVGDRCELQADAFPALSEIPYERFIDFVARVPVGKVVTYQHIITGIGVSTGYFRALPGYLRKASARAPLHRVVDTAGNLTPHVPLQHQRLAAEGVPIIARSLQTGAGHSFVPASHYWSAPVLYLP